MIATIVDELHQADVNVDVSSETKCTHLEITDKDHWLRQYDYRAWREEAVTSENAFGNY